MSRKPPIPIKNIYYMLCYAWKTLKQSDNILLGSEKFDNIYNLFARIYINGTKSIIKRGLNKYYVEETEPLSTLRGKIKIAESTKGQTIRSGRMICQYDNFSENTELNQIVKATINILIKVPKLDIGLKKDLLKHRLHFSNVENIKFSKQLFSSLRYNQNNYHYRMLINISEMIYQGLITEEKDNQFLFSDFIRDRQMANLYEKFVLNFYRLHLDPKKYKIHSPRMKWELSREINAEELVLLPQMRTDIVVEDKKRQLIIDTKFYSETLVLSYRGKESQIEKVRSSHLFQIFAYIKNSKFSGEVKGMLLYPTIEKDVNADFPVIDSEIAIRTLNLNAEWGEISNRLLSLVE